MSIKVVKASQVSVNISTVLEEKKSGNIMFNKIFIFILCKCVLHLHVCMYTMYVSGAHGDQKKGFGPSGPLQEQCMLLITELFSSLFYNNIIISNL